MYIIYARLVGGQIIKSKTKKHRTGRELAKEMEGVERFGEPLSTRIQVLYVHASEDAHEAHLFLETATQQVGDVRQSREIEDTQHDGEIGGGREAGEPVTVRV